MSIGGLESTSGGGGDKLFFFQR